MSERDTIAVFAEEIGSAIKPLANALSSPANFTSFMWELGWEINAVPQPMKSLTGAIDNISNLLTSGSIDTAKVPSLIDGIKGFISSLNDLSAAAEAFFPTTIDPAAFKTEFPLQLLQYLIVEHLMSRHHALATALRASGVLTIENVAAAALRPGYVKRTIVLGDLVSLLSDPLTLIKNAYKWDTSDFKAEAFVQNLAALLRAWGVHVSTTIPDIKVRDFLMQGAIPARSRHVHSFALRAPFVDDVGSSVDLEAGVKLFMLPETNTDKPGFAVSPYGQGASRQHLQLTENVSLFIEGDADFTAGVGILVRPTKPIELLKDIIPSATAGVRPPSGAAVTVGVEVAGTDATPIIVLGSSEATRLELGNVSIRGGVYRQSQHGNDLFIELDLASARLIVRPKPDETDGFLAKLLPRDPLMVDCGVVVGLSPRRGFYFGGSSALEVSLPAHVQIGPVEILAARFAVKPSAQGIPIELGTTVKGNLGPLVAVVENVGLRGVFSFPVAGGNLGPLDVALQFKAPNGVGLSIDASAIKGGGYLFIDAERGEYAGALELTFSGFLALKAIGIITTRMPDGSDGYSLLIIITAEFGTGIQLGFGFTLLAVGGLIGVNRTMRLEPLMEGVRTGAVNGIMFPRDVVANAPRIISDLRLIFPPQDNKFLIGPMAKLGWGTPTLISLSLGIIIEIPGNIAILGVLKLILPAKEASVLILQVNFVGAIEFDKKRLFFFAGLFESRVLFAPIEGEMGVLGAFGDDANFVVSVGGFHPRFNPPPLPFASPRRVSIDLVNTSVARVRVEGYFGVTTNTAQFGARAELFFGLDELNVSGHVAFDALLQFFPFYFMVEISTSFSVKVFGLGLYSVRVQLSLEGPTPWRARGKGEISLLFLDIPVDIDRTWGEKRDTTLPAITVMPLLKAEFDKAENWRAILPAANNLLVSLRRLPPEEAALVLHPVGVLRVTQKAFPLELRLDKVGNQKPNDVNRLSVRADAGGLAKSGDVFEQFAPGQFQEMDDAQKLSRPAYGPEKGGLDLSVAGRQIASTRMTRRVVRYEEITLDTRFRRRVRQFTEFATSMFDLFAHGGSVSKSELSRRQKMQLQPFKETIDVQAETYTVVFQSNNNAYSAAAKSFPTEASARDYMEQQLTRDPSLREALHVMPEFEIAA